MPVLEGVFDQRLQNHLRNHQVLHRRGYLLVESEIVLLKAHLLQLHVVCAVLHLLMDCLLYTSEKGHPAVHQWNYCVGNSDFSMSVGYKAENSMETVNHKAGDWSFIPAGADHDLVSEPGKEVYYVWFEHYTNEKQLKRED